MHYFIYKAYRKRFKRGFFDILKSLPDIIKLSLSIWLSLFLISLVIAAIIPSNTGRIVFSFIPAVTTIILCAISSIYNHKILDARMEERKERIIELENWLYKDIKFKDKNSVEHLYNRMKIEIDKGNKSIAKFEGILLRIFQFICFPIVLAAFTRFLQLDNAEFSEKILIGAVLVVLVLLSLGAVLYFIYFVMTEIVKNQIYNYQMFVDDLEDILYYDYREEDNHNDTDTVNEIAEVGSV